jgi:hypothetical protein
MIEAHAFHLSAIPHWHALCTLGMQLMPRTLQSEWRGRRRYEQRDVATRSDRDARTPRRIVRREWRALQPDVLRGRGVAAGAGNVSGQCNVLPAKAALEQPRWRNAQAAAAVSCPTTSNPVTAATIAQTFDMDVKEYRLEFAKPGTGMNDASSTL